MKASVIKDLGDSAKAFLQVVSPKMLELGWIRGKVVPVESVTRQDITKDLDTLAGIDAWSVENNIGIIGIASRIQWGTKNWGTFTVRYSRDSGASTEYEKRLMAFQSEGKYLYPHYSCQAYIKERPCGQLLAVALAPTKDIWDMIDKGYAYKDQVKSNGAEFFVVRWDSMIKHDYLIQSWDYNKQNNYSLKLL